MRSAALLFAILSGVLAAYLVGYAAFDPSIALHPSTARAAPLLRTLLTGLAELIGLAGAIALVRARLAGLLLLIAAVVWAALTYLLARLGTPLLYGPAALSLLAALCAFVARAPRAVVVEASTPVVATPLRSEPSVVAAAVPVAALEASGRPDLVTSGVVEQPVEIVTPAAIVETPAETIVPAAATVEPQMVRAEPVPTRVALPEGPAFTESGAEAWVDENHLLATSDEPSAFASFALSFSNVVTFIVYGLVAAAILAMLLAPPNRSMLRRSLPPGATSSLPPVIEPTSSASSDPTVGDPAASSFTFSLPDLPSTFSAASEPPADSSGDT